MFDHRQGHAGLALQFAPRTDIHIGQRNCDKGKLQSIVLCVETSCQVSLRLEDCHSDRVRLHLSLTPSYQTGLMKKMPPGDGGAVAVVFSVETKLNNTDLESQIAWPSCYLLLILARGAALQLASNFASECRDQTVCKGFVLPRCRWAVRSQAWGSRGGGGGRASLATPEQLKRPHSQSLRQHEQRCRISYLFLSSPPLSLNTCLDTLSQSVTLWRSLLQSHASFRHANAKRTHCTWQELQERCHCDDSLSCEHVGASWASSREG